MGTSYARFKDIYTLYATITEGTEETIDGKVTLFDILCIKKVICVFFDCGVAIIIYGVFIQIALLCVGIIPTEISLNKNFDKNGRRK